MFRMKYEIYERMKQYDVIILSIYIIYALISSFLLFFVFNTIFCNDMCIYRVLNVLASAINNNNNKIYFLFKNNYESLKKND